MGEEANRRREAGQRYRGQELVKEVADFKARVKLLAEQRAREMDKRQMSLNPSKSFLLSGSWRNKEDFEIGAARWKFMGDGSTLAREKSAHLVRYIVSKKIAY